MESPRRGVSCPKAASPNSTSERAAAGLPLFANRAQRRPPVRSSNWTPPSSRPVPLAFIAHSFGLLEGGAELQSQSEMFKLLAELRSQDQRKTLERPDTAKDIIEGHPRELDAVRRDFEYETDGAVVKVDNFAQRQPPRASTPRPRAGRWLTSTQAERVETRLLDIVRSRSAARGS